MSTTLTRKRMRFALVAHSHERMKCLLTNNPPKLWRGVDLQIETALFIDSNLVDDLTSVAQVVCEVHTTDRDDDALLQKTVSSFTACTAQNWTTKAADQYHALFEFTAAETQVDMTGAQSNSRTFWLVFHAVTDTGLRVTLGSADLVVEEDGAQNGMDVVGTTIEHRFSPTTGLLQLFNPDTGKWHSIQPRGAAGAVITAWEQTGED